MMVSTSQALAVATASKGEEAVCDIDALPEELKGVVHAFCKEHVYYVS